MNEATPNPLVRPRVLRLLLEIPETNAPFHQLSLPLADRHEITLCTYFPAASSVPETIRLHEGNGSLRGYLRVLGRALRAQPYDVIHVHTPHVGIVLLLFACLRPHLLASTVMTVHNCYENHKFRNRLMLLPAFAWFHRIICCGQAAANSFPRSYHWLAGTRLKWISNGVPTARIDRVRQSSDCLSGDDRFTVLSVSRLVPIKNLHTALAAFADASDHSARLVCVGDGPEALRLQDETAAHRIETRVEWTGLLPRERVYQRMFAADLFISTSLGEGLPVAVLEAMACGCPVVLSDIAPHREIAQEVDFIPLVAAQDRHGFADQIRRFRQMTPQQRQQIGDQCARLVRERFSLEAMHDAYDRLFHEVAELEQGRADHAC